MRRAICAILGLIVVFWTCGHASSGYYYYYFDQRIDLAAEPGTIAALDETGVGPEDLGDLLGEAGYPGAGLQQHPIPKWRLVELRSASAPPVIEGVASVIANLIRLDDPSRFFFSPILHSPSNPSGGQLIVTPSIVAKFEKGVSDQRIDELLVLADAPGADKEPFGWLANTFKITNHFRSGIEVLDIANCLAGFSEVVYSEPGMIVTGTVAGGPPAEPRDIPQLTPVGLLILSLAVVLCAHVVQRRVGQTTRQE